MSFSAKINIVFDILNKQLDWVKDQVNATRGLTFQDGTGANQADTLWRDERTLADGASEELDLNDGSLTDAFGDAVTIDTLKAIYIKNNSSDANLLVGGAAANAIELFADSTDIKKVRPGGDFLDISPDINGIDLTTNPKLKIAHDGTGTSSLTYDIIVVGVD